MLTKTPHIPTDWSLYLREGSSSANQAITNHLASLLSQNLSNGQTSSSMATKLQEFEHLGATDTAVREILNNFLDDYYERVSQLRSTEELAASALSYVSTYSTPDQWSCPKTTQPPQYCYLHAGARLHMVYEQHENPAFALGLEPETAQITEDALFLHTFEQTIAPYLSQYLAELLVHKLQAMYPPSNHSSTLTSCATDATPSHPQDLPPESPARTLPPVPIRWSLYRQNGHLAANKAITEHLAALLSQNLSQTQVATAMATKLREFESFGATDTAVREILNDFLDNYFARQS